VQKLGGPPKYTFAPRNLFLQEIYLEMDQMISGVSVVQFIAHNPKKQAHMI
jgi:hypothetical protein